MKRYICLLFCRYYCVFMLIISISLHFNHANSDSLVSNEFFSSILCNRLNQKLATTIKQFVIAFKTIVNSFFAAITVITVINVAHNQFKRIIN